MKKDKTLLEKLMPIQSNNGNFKPKWLGLDGKKPDGRIEYHKYYIYVYNEQGLETYFEDSDKFWRKTEYNEQGLETYFEDSDKFWRKTEYNEQGLQTYSENSNNCWSKEIDGKTVEFENGKYFIDGVEHELKD